MIKIAAMPLDIETIINQYPPNSIAFLILNTLEKSNTVYEYPSLDALNFELDLRSEIVKAAKDLHNSRMDFAVFRKTLCNDAYWNRAQDGGFVLKNSVKPSDAINDIFTNGQLYATECATAMVMIYYKAILMTMGEERFNRLFTEITLMNWHYLDPRIDVIGDMQRVTDYLPGDRRYFSNPDVDPKTPEWQGENTIDLSGNLYYGHGIGIHNAAEIIKALNGNRKTGATKSAYLMEAVGRPNFNSLFQLH